MSLTTDSDGASVSSQASVPSLLDSTQRVEIEQAVRERIGLHPQARVHEIQAMLELDGVRAPSELVQRISDEMHASEESCDLSNRPPAPRQPR